MPTPAEKAAATRASFERKVSLIEGWARDGLPTGQYCPRKVGELAKWHDPALGIYRWGSPNVTSPRGKHADLRVRFDEAVGDIEIAEGGQRGIARLRAENRALRIRNRQLAEQIVDMIQRLMNLERLFQQQAALLKQAGESAAGGKVHHIGPRDRGPDGRRR